ncbi:TetR/AcrR family transcriptional regulator [Thalassospira marina]|uniref:TetR family transcriptional regulator n=1 Tax=Thalassospira marina TaxID=2048283 RepID=A0A2N3KWQ7_9PROT|nr:TetR/AcrR family transcriptional regulator [Thalassospira marina]PKR55015.1 TetR family transcriptional regulator [Thalassospira marina]
MGRHREFDLEKTLDAMMVVFWEKGYEGTSFDDLTRATGVARPGLYAAFGNKETLFRKALDRYEAKHLAFMKDAMNEPEIKTVIRRVLEESVIVQTLGGACLGCLGINGAMACSADAEPVRQELIRRRSISEEALRNRLERAKQDGELPPQADCALLSGYIMAVNQGLAVQAKGGTPREDLLKIVHHVVASWPGSVLVQADARAEAS